MRKYLFIIWLSIIAWINAIILSYKAYQFQFLPAAERPLSFCDINAVFSCTQVLAHPASLIFGIPFPMIAFLVYPIIAGIALYGYIWKNTKIMQIILLLSGMGILFNSFFIYREATIIQSYCYLCLICSAIIVTIFVISGFGTQEYRKWKTGTPE